MTIQEHTQNFVFLGQFLSQFGVENSTKIAGLPANDPHFEEMERKIDASIHHNGWFNRENIIFSLQQWSKALSEKNLEQWTQMYSFSEHEPKRVGIVMAGNIPLVGFHDFLAVLISGHKVLAKLSSNDQQLLPVISSYLIDLDNRYEKLIEFTNKELKYFDAVIATGSDNTARYFEYYFKDRPNIIRRNRNSVAVLTGRETTEELEKLGDDIFQYYGLGCRNVSKLFVPENYNFNSFFEAIYKWNPIIDQNKYANNYDYNKAVYLMSEFKLLDNGFLMLKEDESFGSPIATVFYSVYKDEKDLKLQLLENKDKLQCVVKKDAENGEVSFGQTQQPQLWDYADNVDTIEFLLRL